MVRSVLIGHHIGRHLNFIVRLRSQQFYSDSLCPPFYIPWEYAFSFAHIERMNDALFQWYLVRSELYREFEQFEWCVLFSNTHYRCYWLCCHWYYSLVLHQLWYVLVPLPMQFSKVHCRNVIPWMKLNVGCPSHRFICYEKIIRRIPDIGSIYEESCYRH